MVTWDDLTAIGEQHYTTAEEVDAALDRLARDYNPALQTEIASLTASLFMIREGLRQKDGPMMAGLMFQKAAMTEAEVLALAKRTFTDRDDVTVALAELRCRWNPDLAPLMARIVQRACRASSNSTLTRTGTSGMSSNALTSQPTRVLVLAGIKTFRSV